MKDAIERWGTTGEALVLIHGFTGHPGHWLPIAEHFAGEGHTVLAPRLAGHATNPSDLALTTATSWVEAARAAVAAAADHRHVHLVGLSMGGLIAIELAAATGASSITTINSPVVLRDRKAYLAPLARRWIGFTVAEITPSPDPDLDHLWDPYPLIPTAAVAELGRLMRRAVRVSGRLRRPSLVVQSRTDETVLPVSGPILAHRLGGRLLWLEQARHNAILDPARTTVEVAIDRLIRDVRR